MTNLGLKIRELRKRKDISQEVLAEALCVSFQAVSKWETGASLPDVTLIPAIATFFGVSTDELFDYDRYKHDAKIEEIVCKAADIRNDRPEEAEKIIRDGLKLFPGNDILLNNLLYTLRPERRDESATICRSLVEATSDDAVKYDAMRILAEIYAAKGELLLCEETLEKIPEIYFTKLELVAELLKGEKSFNAADSQFGLDFDSAISMLSIMRERAAENGDAGGAEKYRKSAVALIDALKAAMPEYFAGFRKEEYEKYAEEFAER